VQVVDGGEAAAGAEGDEELARALLKQVEEETSPLV